MNNNIWYYLGYVITFSSLGFIVADRVDRCNPSYPMFGSLKVAMAYVDSVVVRGDAT